MKHQFVDLHRHNYTIKALCRALQISPSRYYTARSRPPSRRSERQHALTSKIQSIHIASRQTYGAPRIHAELLAQGIACSHNTVAKLMRQADIVPRATRKFRVTTDSRHTKAAPNLQNREFAVGRPNQCWVSDITFIPTRESRLYLAAVMDLHSRAIVGWAIEKTLDARLAIDALAMAIHRRGTGPDIVHSDRGSTYAAADYRALLGKHCIRQSMSRKGDCWDTQSMMVPNACRI